MDRKFTLEDVLRATKGELLENPELSSSSSNTLTNIIDDVTYDSREAKPGSLFVAMLGEFSDGHLFIPDALKRGASYLMVRQDWAATQSELPPVPTIAVADTLDALQDLTRWWLSAYTQTQVTGITGSVGKSSTKELIAAVLSQRFRTFKSPKNINDQQSLMPVLLRMQPGYEQAVLEMGCGWAFGELTRLCRVTHPRIGVVMGVSHSHIGRMKSLENIAIAKAELVQSLPADGYAVLNGDDERVYAMAQVTNAKPFYFGLKPHYNLWASDIESFGLDGLAFTAHYGEDSYRFRVPFTGRHFVTNLLAAIAVGLINNLTWEEIERGLQEREAQVRLLVVSGPNNSTIIDDTYNASPVSTVAALDFLEDIASIAAKNNKVRKIAVLSDMLELGDYECEAHEIVGRRAAQVADWLLVTGDLGRIIGETALAQGFDPDHVIFAASKAEIVRWLQEQLTAGDYVLVKASRGMRLDEVVTGLTEQAVEAANLAEIGEGKVQL